MFVNISDDDDDDDDDDNHNYDDDDYSDDGGGDFDHENGNGCDKHGNRDDSDGQH